MLPPANQQTICQLLAGAGSVIANLVTDPSLNSDKVWI